MLALQRGGCMSVLGPDFPVFSRDKDAILKASRHFYGCAYTDKYLLRDPASLPRYGQLARKLLKHYAGDHYNLHTTPMAIEMHIRELIKGLIEYKVIYRTKGYDWEWIDNFFKKTVSVYFNLDLPFSIERIKQGFAPEFAAPVLMDYDRPN